MRGLVPRSYGAGTPSGSGDAARPQGGKCKGGEGERGVWQVLEKQCEDFVTKLQQVSKKLQQTKADSEEAKKELVGPG